MNSLTSAEIDALERMSGKPELQAYFFARAKNLKWFYPLKDREYFSTESIASAYKGRPEGFVPFWPQGEYLAKASERLGLPENAAFVEEFVGVVRGVTDWARSTNVSNYRVWWSFSKLIQNVPAGVLTFDDLVRVEYWLQDPVETGLVAKELGEGLLKVLLDSNQPDSHRLAAELLGILYHVQVIPGKKKGAEAVAKFRMSSWHADQILEEVGTLAGAKLGWEAISKLLASFEVVLSEVKIDELSAIWRPSIEPHEQNIRSDDVEDVLIDGLRVLISGLVATNQADARKVVERLSGSSFQTVKRIAIWAADKHFDALKPVADDLAVHGFYSSNYRHEFWTFLKNRFGQLSSNSQAAVRASIEGLVIEGGDGQVRGGASEYLQATWLSAIRSYGAEHESAYQARVDVAGAEPQHPEFSFYSFGGPVIHHSALSVEDLLLLDGPSLASTLTKYIESYSPSGGFEGPDIEGLVKTVREVVKADPIGFQSFLPYLIDLDYAYVYELIEGYSEAWKSDAPGPWDSIWDGLLNYILALAGRGDIFTSDGDRREGFIATPRWVVASIGRLLESAVRADEHALGEQFHPLVEQILAVVLEKQAGDQFAADSDAVSIAINSPRGQAIEALINLVLRCCRLCDKEVSCKSAVWEKFAPRFNSELSMPGNYEFSTLVVRYLPNFLYMSSSWVFDNFDRIFPADDELKWRCAMQGYASVSTVYQGVYDRLKEGGHLARALDDAHLRKRVSEKVVQNIVVASLNGFDPIDGGSIDWLLARRRDDELGHLAWFVWTLRVSKDDGLRGRIFLLWKKLLATVPVGSPEGRALASRLANWIDFVESVDDDNRGLLLQVAPYCDLSHNGYGFMKALGRIAASQPIEAGNILLSMLSESVVTHPEDAIRRILDALVGSGVAGRLKAREVAGKFAEHGFMMPAEHLLKSTLT